jgi:hypothetical protein
VGPGVVSAPTILDAEAACEELVISELAQVSAAEVAGLVTTRLGPGMAEPLGLPPSGEVSCDEVIEAEYAGSVGVRQLLLECERGDVGFLVAVAPRGESIDLRWFGATDLAGALVAARGRLSPGDGRLAVRFYPEVGKAVLFRRGTWPGVWISTD